MNKVSSRLCLLLVFLGIVVGHVSAYAEASSTLILSEQSNRTVKGTVLAQPRCPYHGIAAPAGATCSQVAKTLGWSEEVWDLSGEMPKLK